MNTKRPVNLDLGSLKYPPMAIASILHRLSGLALFLLMPVMLYLLDLSLRSPESFAGLQTSFSNPWLKVSMWIFGAAWVYHLLAGIRHLLMDVGIGETLPTGKYSANFVVILAIILAILLGVWIW